MEGFGWEGPSGGVPTTPKPLPLTHLRPKNFNYDKREGPEWDYATLNQPEGMDRVDQVTSSASHASMCFME
eukprot:scaffold56865_cov17-Tisochrysis_lutea.AAC.2